MYSVRTSFLRVFRVSPSIQLQGVQMSIPDLQTMFCLLSRPNLCSIQNKLMNCLGTCRSCFLQHPGMSTRQPFTYVQLQFHSIPYLFSFYFTHLRWQTVKDVSTCSTEICLMWTPTIRPSHCVSRFKMHWLGWTYCCLAKGSKTGKEEEAGDDESPTGKDSFWHLVKGYWDWAWLSSWLSMLEHRQQTVFGRNQLVVVDTACDQLWSDVLPYWYGGLSHITPRWIHCGKGCQCGTNEKEERADNSMLLLWVAALNLIIPCLLIHSLQSSSCYLTCARTHTHGQTRTHTQRHKHVRHAYLDNRKCTHVCNRTYLYLRTQQQKHRTRHMMAAPQFFPGSSQFQGPRGLCWRRACFSTWESGSKATERIIPKDNHETKKSMKEGVNFVFPARTIQPDCRQRAGVRRPATQWWRLVRSDRRAKKDRDTPSVPETCSCNAHRRQWRALSF